MKRIFIGALLCAFLMVTSASAIDAVGSVFGNLSTANALGQGKADFTAGVGLADATSFFGMFNYGLSKYMNGRLKLGLSDPGDGADTKIVFGADLLWQIWDFVPTGPDPQGGGRYPFDMAVGGIFEYADYGQLSVLELGGFALGSYPVRMQNGSTLAPYGRLNLRLESVSYDIPGVNIDGDSNLEFGINGGLKWQITNATSVFGEFQFDGNDGVFFGLNFNVM
jgi:hypothetical protein